MRLRLPCGVHCWQNYIPFYYVVLFKTACHRGITWSDVRSIDQIQINPPYLGYTIASVIQDSSRVAGDRYRHRKQTPPSKI